MKEIRQELAKHVGGKPSVAQSMLIERIAVLILRMELMDKEALSGGPMTDKDQRTYLGWANAVSRSLRHLGLKGQEGKAPSLDDILKAGKGQPAP